MSSPRENHPNSTIGERSFADENDESDGIQTASLGAPSGSDRQTGFSSSPLSAPPSSAPLAKGNNSGPDRLRNSKTRLLRLNALYDEDENDSCSSSSNSSYGSEQSQQRQQQQSQDRSSVLPDNTSKEVADSEFRVQQLRIPSSPSSTASCSLCQESSESGGDDGDDDGDDDIVDDENDDDQYFLLEAMASLRELQSWEHLLPDPDPDPATPNHNNDDNDAESNGGPYNNDSVMGVYNDTSFLTSSSETGNSDDGSTSGSGRGGSDHHQRTTTNEARGDEQPNQKQRHGHHNNPPTIVCKNRPAPIATGSYDLAANSSRTSQSPLSPLSHPESTQSWLKEIKDEEYEQRKRIAEAMNAAASAAAAPSSPATPTRIRTKARSIRSYTHKIFSSNKSNHSETITLSPSSKANGGKERHGRIGRPMLFGSFLSRSRSRYNSSSAPWKQQHRSDSSNSNHHNNNTHQKDDNRDDFAEFDKAATKTPPRSGIRHQRKKKKESKSPAAAKAANNNDGINSTKDLQLKRTYFGSTRVMTMDGIVESFASNGADTYAASPRNEPRGSRLENAFAPTSDAPLTWV